VHMLSTHAFNAMLKTLEEPPDYLKFILATTDPQKVPPTVLSRCLQFNLRPMPPALVQQHLGTVLAQEGVDAEAGALRLLSRAARGSMRDALSLTDQAIAFGAGRLVEAEVLRMLGSTPRAHVLALLDALSAADAPALVAEVQALQLSGHTGTGALDELARWLQLMALAQAAPQALDPADPDTADAVTRAPQWPADELQLAYSLSLQGRAELALAPDEYAGLTMVLLRVLAFRPGHEVAMPSRSAPLRQSSTAPLARLVVPVVVAAPAPAPAPVPVAAAQPRPSAAPAPPAVQALAPAAADEPPPWLDLPPEEDGAPSVDAAPAPALAPVAEAPAPNPTGRTPVPSAAPQVLVPTPTGEAWAALVPQLGATALSRTLAMQAQCLVLDRGTDAWRVSLQVASETLRSGPAVSKLQGLLEQLAGVPVQLSVQAGVATDTPALRDSAAAVAAQAAAEAELERSPELAALRRHFDTTRITPGSIKPV